MCEMNSGKQLEAAFTLRDDNKLAVQNYEVIGNMTKEEICCIEKISETNSMCL
jgi:hypothetical protein